MCKQDEDALRNTGRTTNIVLALVRKALDNAGLKIEARDHYENAYAHWGVARAAGRVLDELHVPHVIYRPGPRDDKSYIMVEPRR